MNIEGKLIEKFDTQQIKDTFKKREFVVKFHDIFVKCFSLSTRLFEKLFHKK